MKTIIFFLLALILSFGSFAQDTTQVSNSATESASNFDKSKLYYGGYMSLSFGSYTIIGIEPMVGYKVTPEFSLGGSLSYEYSSYKDYSASNYGASVFSRYRIVPKIYTHVEFSAINYEVYSLSFQDYESDRKWVPFLFVGGGFSQPISRNTWLTAQVLFDVINHKYSPYSDWEPFFSVGIGVGF